MTTEEKTPSQPNIVQSMFKTGLYVASIVAPSYISYNIGLQIGKNVHDIKKMEKRMDFSKSDVNRKPNFIRYNNTVKLRKLGFDGDSTSHVTTYHNIPTDAINYIDRVLTESKSDNPISPNPYSIQIIHFPFRIESGDKLLPTQFTEINETQFRLIKELLQSFTASHIQ